MQPPSWCYQEGISNLEQQGQENPKQIMGVALVKCV